MVAWYWKGSVSVPIYQQKAYWVIVGTAQRIIGNLHVVSEHYIACWVIVDEHHMYHSIKIYKTVTKDQEDGTQEKDRTEGD